MPNVQLDPKYEEAEREARRFLAKMYEFKNAAVASVHVIGEPPRLYEGSPMLERAALKRASMDLTRALAKLRA